MKIEGIEIGIDKIGDYFVGVFELSDSVYTKATKNLDELLIQAGHTIQREQGKNFLSKPNVTI